MLSRLIDPSGEHQGLGGARGNKWCSFLTFSKNYMRPDRSELLQLRKCKLEAEMREFFQVDLKYSSNIFSPKAEGDTGGVTECLECS